MVIVFSLLDLSSRRRAPIFLSFFIFFEAETGLRCSLISTSCSAKMVTMSIVLVRRFIENMMRKW